MHINMVMAVKASYLVLPQPPLSFSAMLPVKRETAHHLPTCKQYVRTYLALAIMASRLFSNSTGSMCLRREGLSWRCHFQSSREKGVPDLVCEWALV